jgi:hypothetical protein
MVFTNICVKFGIGNLAGEMFQGMMWPGEVIPPESVAEFTGVIY